MSFVTASVVHTYDLILPQPPAVLNSILRQFEELADELWPPTTREDDTKITPVCNERSAGIEGIEGV